MTLSCYDMTIKLDLCEKILGYTFIDKSLCLEALQRYSALPQAVSYKGNIYHVPKNSRLEMMGDKVLDFVLAKQWFPTGLTNSNYDNIRQQQACNRNLSRTGQRLGLSSCMFYHPSASVGIGMMAGTVEALIGAAYSDGGWDAAEQVIRKLGLLDHSLFIIH